MKKEKEFKLPKGYTVIPAEVRFSRQISLGAKLLYGDIRGLSFETGFCKSSNEWLAKCYDVDDKTISSWISQLVKAGFIKSVILRNYERKLIPLVKIIQEIKIDGVEDNATGVSEKAVSTPPQKPDNNSIIYNNINNTADAMQPIGDKNDSKNEEIKFLIGKFIPLDPVNRTYFSNKTQRDSCKFLLEEYGLEKVLSAIGNVQLAKKQKLDFFPEIYTPYDLKTKWQKLKSAIERLSKQKV